MEIGALISFGSVVPGKEKAAVELFAETTRVYGEKLAEGTFTHFEPFMFRTGDFQEQLGFFVVKGEQEKVNAFYDSEQERTLRARVEQVVNHLKIELLYTGEDVLEEVAIFGRLAEERQPALAG